MGLITVTEQLGLLSLGECATPLCRQRTACSPPCGRLTLNGFSALERRHMEMSRIPLKWRQDTDWKLAAEYRQIRLAKGGTPD
ncbi:hypothetical protein SKAU_G00227510 [Synaphobranchus kaupii]|uniref:Uncharacterized protein n=1 Tax=Synaphobranchus kaupii TaxID=118154 RepID=A0A9Q1F538_SYNKA|nr:hypothetical protein SKAU_G00227510 [Synaphobranchus kaupii]